MAHAVVENVSNEIVSDETNEIERRERPKNLARPDNSLQRRASHRARASRRGAASGEAEGG